MAHRIAVIGHGDHAEALRIIGRGELEPYFGMTSTLRVLDELFESDPYLVISLSASRHRETRGAGELLGIPAPKLPSPLPGTIAMVLWGRQIVRELERFEPTQVLLRTPGIPGIHVLRYCIDRRISTLVTFANLFDPNADLVTRLVNRRLVALLNDPCVFLVGNHKQPATDSMVRFGVDSRKAVAWDWPGAKHPRDWSIKALREGEPWRLLYVGSISELKGVGDLVDAVKLLHGRGRPIRLTAVGDGPDVQSIRARVGSLPPETVHFSGRVANDDAFRMMRESVLVCVPSRHEFQEGMPLTLTEALASRTPVVASDHPVFTAAFQEGEGMRFFHAGDSSALAETIEAVLDDPKGYHQLSRSTAAAFSRVECPTSFGDLVERWKNTFRSGSAAARGSRLP